MNDSLHLNILPENQLKLFKILANNTIIEKFYLAGGTALALHFGHRQSIDFDFFIPADINTSELTTNLIQLGDYERENEEKNTINGILNGVRISFFGYKYLTIDTFLSYNKISVAGKKDIAAMKLEAIAGRGSMKDFIDLYFLLNEFTIKEMLAWHNEKYGRGLSNQYHLLKSLIYFEDAEEEVTPVMLKQVKWHEVKQKIVQEVKKEHFFM